MIVDGAISGMFEEAQLYSPVTHDEHGEVTVHLSEDHPGAGDPKYCARRNEIAALALAWEPGTPVPEVRYTEAEQEVWRTVCRELAPKHERLAIREFLEAKERLRLPTDGVPSLDLVSDRLRPLTGFHYAPAAGLVPLREFYGSLADRLFHSTQYVRHPAMPLYTPEPDIIHEVIGHGHLLATPHHAPERLEAPRRPLPGGNGEPAPRRDRAPLLACRLDRLVARRADRSERVVPAR
jgi:phenylalanine-4-hydroxylase